MVFLRRFMSAFPFSTPRLWIAIYILAVYVLALRPFNFIPVCFHQEIKWLPEEQGMRSGVCSAVSSPGPALSFYNAFKGKRRITVEVWLRPKTNEQWGPARIISYSADTARRNFTLGQDRDDLVFRLRTRITDRNGINPHIKVPGFFRPGVKQHIVLTYDGKTESVYLDGRLIKQTAFLTGTFANWNQDCFLLIGNELTANRPWQGDIFLFAVYNRALSSSEVRQNCRAVLHSQGEEQKGGRAVKGLVGLYDFSEGEGEWVKDRSPEKQAGDMTIADYRNFMQTISADFAHNFYMDDMLINVFGFIPISFLVFFNCPAGRLKRWFCIYGIPLTVGCLISFSIEYFQRYILFRNANLWDLIYNFSGTLIGALLLHGWLWVRDRRD